jgi:hypothetical protein
MPLTGSYLSTPSFLLVLLAALLVPGIGGPVPIGAQDRDTLSGEPSPYRLLRQEESWGTSPGTRKGPLGLTDS